MSGTQMVLALRRTALLAFLLPRILFSQERPVALVETISGEVFLRSTINAKVVTLDPRLDLARRLYPGQQLRCNQGGRIRMRVHGRAKEIHGPSDWSTIPAAASGRPVMPG